jgi:hypothetical protein
MLRRIILTTTRSISPRSKANRPTRYGVTTRPHRWLALILFDFAGHPARHQAPAPRKLNITRTPFDEMNGNIQGFENGHELAVNPVAALPHKTTFHEIAQIVPGHTTSEKSWIVNRTQGTSARSKRSLSPPFATKHLASKARTSAGYIQHWLKAEKGIPNHTAAHIFADPDVARWLLGRV